MAISESLQQLVATFYRDVELARRLPSGNLEDDLVIKLAVVGFSYNSPTREWAQNHFDFVTSRLNSDFQDAATSEYGENSQNVRLFAALALGYLLGAFQQNMIGDSEFQVAEWQIPGLIMLHLSRITSQPA